MPATLSLAPSRFGICELQMPIDKSLNRPVLHRVIVPPAAFDDHYNRFGTGGGCYDRAFAFLNRHNC